MGVFFGNPEDRSLTEFTQATIYTRGYNVQLAQNGQFVLQRYDGQTPVVGQPPWAYVHYWDSPWVNNIVPGLEYRIKIRVRPDRIVVGPVTQAEGATNARTFNAATGGGDLWRGPYAYVGRHFYTTSDSTRVRFRNFKLAAV